jgi:hypothetical protein
MRNDEQRRQVVGALAGLLVVSGAGVLFGQAASPVRPPPATAPAATPDYQPAQKIEARKGATWAAAAVLKKEGRRVQVRYGDGTEAWVTADQLRASEVGGGGGAAAKPVANDQYAIGAKVETKSVGAWDRSTIKNRSGDLYLIVRDDFPDPFHWQWVHVSIVRNRGDKSPGPDGAAAVTVGNSTIPEAKAKAAQQFADLGKWVADQKREAGERAAAAAAAAAPADFQPNQKVEARVGDAWSSATVVKREGRKVQVRHGSGAEEWVTADRLRVPGAGDAGGGRGGPPAAPPAKGPAGSRYAVGSEVEVKIGLWKTLAIKEQDGDLYLVVPVGPAPAGQPKELERMGWFWAHVSMIRNLGERKEGPIMTSPLHVGMSSVAEAKAEARTHFARSPDPQLAAAMAAEGPAGTAAAAAAAAEQYAVGSKVEVQHGSFWEAGTVRSRDGNLYLVVRDDFPDPFQWMWAHVSMVRNRGDKAKVGPGVHAVVVVNDGVAVAKAKAAKRFADLGKPVAGNATANPQAYVKTTTLAVMTGVRNVVPATVAKLLVPEPAAAVKVSGRPLLLNGGADWAGSKVDVLFAGPFALATLYGRSTSGAADVRVGRVNLTTGVADPATHWDETSVPAALSPSGRRVLGRTTGDSFGFGKRRRLDLWDLPPAAGKVPPDPSHVVGFVPYAAEPDEADRDVVWAALTDDDHVVTCGWKGELVCWKVGPGVAAAVWRARVTAPAQIALSPSGTRLACMTDAGLAVLGVATGETLSLIGPPRQLSALTYTADGRQVVGVAMTVLSQWDLDKGAFGGDLALGGEARAWNVTAAGDGYVLVTSQMGDSLVDLARRTVVWWYRGAGTLAAHGGRVWTTVGAADFDKGKVLLSADLPHDAGRRAAAKLGAGVDPKSMLLRPGMSVSLDVSVDGPEEQRKGTADLLTAELRRNGITVAEGQPVKMVARVDNGPTFGRIYQAPGSFGPPGPLAEVGFQIAVPKVTRLAIEVDGTVAWEALTTVLPDYVRQMPGTPGADVTAAANKFNASFLRSVPVPAYLPKPRDASSPVGNSSWTTTGIVDRN